MNAPRRSGRIKAVLFDLDDTLLDWSNMDVEWRENTRVHLNNVHEFLSKNGHGLPTREAFFDTYVDVLIQSWDEAKKTWAGVHFVDVLKESFERCGLVDDQIDYDEVMAAYDWRPMPGVTPYDDAIPVLDSLQCGGYAIGLVTNSMFPMWMRDIELRAYDLIDYFDVRISSGETGYMKPHPAIYARALELLNVRPQESIFVGDRPVNDIAGAIESGIVSVLMSPPHLDRDLDGIVPDYTITHLSELLTVLEALELESS